MTIRLAQCDFCRHFWGLHDSDFRCAAFPGGTPDDYLDDVLPHNVPSSLQDNGIVFEPRDGAEPVGLAFIQAWHRGEVQIDEDNEEGF